MNLKRCNNGHFYDADKYTSCPHCNPTVSASEVTVALNTENMSADVKSAFDDDSKTVSLQDAVNAAVEPVAPVAAPAAAPAPVAAPSDDAKTVSYYSTSIGAEPVVGWLVCIEGDHYGESFQLKSGRNFVGRNSNMDVVLAGDMSVSRERHAVIIYEPKAKCFIAQAGDARELFYLNDGVVLNNEMMKNYDVLTIGNEKLLFVALCGPQFCWEDTKKEEEPAVQYVVLKDK